MEYNVRAEKISLSFICIFESIIYLDILLVISYAFANSTFFYSCKDLVDLFFFSLYFISNFNLMHKSWSDIEKIEEQFTFLKMVK